MSNDVEITLSEAAQEHLELLVGDDVTVIHAEVERFVRWAGAGRLLGQLTANDVAKYAEMFGGSVTDAAQRGAAVKQFLAFAKKAGYTSTNLGTHLRIRRGTRKADKKPALDTFEMTADEHAVLESELAALKAQRPEIIEDIRHAMADKDFRENAPLDAARDRQGYVEGRIRELEYKVDQTIIVSPTAAPKGDIVELGCTVVLRNLGTDREVSYTLVRPGEVDAAQRRISFQSPVGQALLKKRAGDEVDVEAPSGTISFRIERVEA